MRMESKFGCAILVSGLFVMFAARSWSQEAPPAPIPAQIYSAKTAFISYAGIDDPIVAAEIAKFTKAPNGLYDQFYARMQSWGRYQLVSSPSDADLIFEISVSYAPTVVDPRPRVHLRILDPKTQVSLWALFEGFVRTPKDLNRVLSKVVTDVQAVAVQPPAAQTNK